ncbi:cache domain-containing protein [Leptolyngbya sp. 'hensonii']|uniref:cache domain-containing protein n=1 Tax=Leptolyngbya sp. 'hensonii' TaxID=1922337 RepID=UPI001C0C1D6F|nr:cache domain-containing protein [Leptolyngbya sp. 'hensonii']
MLLLIVAGFLGNYFRWTLFFDIDFLLGSIAVWIVVCLYGVGWGTLAGLIAGSCTYMIWHHPYTTITFTLEALVVGWLFQKRQPNNIVLLDAIFWLVIGMPLVWLFYAIILQVDPTQFRIILMKQPVNGVFNALAASLLLTSLPIHRWVARPPVINTLSLQQTLFNLLVAFVSFPTLMIIVLASHQVVDDIKATAQSDLNDASRYLTVEVRTWYERRLTAIGELANIAAIESIQSETLHQSLNFTRQAFPDFRQIYLLDEAGKRVLNPEQESPQKPGSAWNDDQYFQKIRQSWQPYLSKVLLPSGQQSSPTVILGMPIVQSGKLIGAILGEIDLDQIAKLLQSNVGGQKLQITLLDPQGTVAASTQPDRIGMTRFDWRRDGEVYALAPQAYHWLPTQGSHLVMVQWTNSFFVKESRVGANLPWTLIVQWRSP